MMDNVALVKNVAAVHVKLVIVVLTLIALVQLLFVLPIPVHHHHLLLQAAVQLTVIAMIVMHVPMMLATLVHVPIQTTQQVVMMETLVVLEMLVLEVFV